MSGLPGRTIVKCVVKVQEERRTGLELVDAVLHTGSRVWDMMKNAQGVAEVHRVISQGDIADACAMKFTVGKGSEFFAGDVQGRVGWIDAVEPSHLLRNKMRPPTASATKVKSC